MYCKCKEPQYDNAYGVKPVTCLKCGKRRKPKGTVESRLKVLEAENKELKQLIDILKDRVTPEDGTIINNAIDNALSTLRGEEVE